MVKSTTTHAENTGAWQLSVIRNSCPMRSLTHKQLNHSKKDTENVYEINKKIMDVMFFSSQGFTFFFKALANLELLELTDIPLPLPPKCWY